MKKIRYDKVSTYFSLNKWSFIIATISGVIFNVLMVFVPYVQGSLIDAFQEQKDVSYIIRFALLFLGFVIFIQINRYLKRYFVRDFSNRMVLQMRKVSFENLLVDDIEVYAKESHGDIMNKNLADIKDSADGVRKALTEVYDTLVLMSGYFISMMIMDYQITLIITIFIVLSILVAAMLKKKIYKAVSSYKKTFSSSKDATLNAVKNELYYRGFGVSENYYQEYGKKMDELEKKSIRSMVLKGSLEPAYKAIALVGLFFVIYLAGKKVMDNVWLIGTFSAYLTTYMLVAKKASKIGKLINAITSFKVSWKRCLPYLKTPKEQKEIILGNEENLKVKDLTFGFDSSFVLHHINFTLNKGESLGICGVIHSGKSTLGAALSGIYDYEGSILLYGNELKEVSNDLKENFISYAPNKVELFNDTLKYNVGFGKKEIDNALENSCLKEDILTFSEKENEILSHSSSNLSGGQGKRLQIARCLNANGKLMVMDDPFNAIDPEMGEKIMDNILVHYPDAIKVIIANRREILSKMNYLLFLKKDSYLYGSYDELLKDEEFAHLFGGKQ